MKVEPASGDIPLEPFRTTRWSVILTCAQSDAKHEVAQRALSALCRAYWRPVFALICHRCQSAADAQDLTQDFFVMLLKGNFLSLAHPSRGRFRSLLRTAVENFLNDKQLLAKAQKRGGGKVQFVPWDEWLAEAPSQLSIGGTELQQWPEDRIFDVRWAASVVEQSLRRLGEECENRGRLRMFTVLSKYLTTERMEISYASLSGLLGVPETIVKRLLHELRVRYRAILREEVGRTVENKKEIDDEIRYLCSALASSQ